MKLGRNANTPENCILFLFNLGKQVDDLKSKLASQEVELAQKNEAANKLIQVVGAETEKVCLILLSFTYYSG